MSTTTNATSIDTGIICSDYKQETNQFIFISKNDDIANSEDYHLNIYYNSNKTALRPVPLLNIKNYPNTTNVHFGGLCSYANSQSSLYLSFEETTTANSTTTLLYQLQLDNTTSLPIQFQKTSLVLFNTTLSSFLYATDVNNTSNLAYISTSKNRQKSLNLINLDHPHYNSTKNISDLGLLAVGGTKSQSLYFIQDNAVDVYRLDTLQYSHSTMQNNMSLDGLRKGATGQVFSTNSSKEYISFYHPNDGKIDIFDIDTSLTNPIPASLTKDGYIDLGNTNATNTYSKDVETPSPTETSHSKRQSSNIYYDISIENPSKRSILKAFSNRFYLKKGTANKALKKRAIETSNDDNQTSSDGAINYHTSQIVPENGVKLPQDVMLVPASTTTTTTTSGSDPYDFALVSGGADPNQFTVTTEPSRSTTSSIETSISTDSMGESYASNLGGGAIAGIVIGVIAFIAIIAGLLFYSKKRKDRLYAVNSRGIKPEMSSFDSNTPLSIQPEDFISARYSGGVGVGATTSLDANHTNTSSILQAATFIPEEYHDGSRPDIRPLSYSEDTIDYAQLSDEELSQLEPDVLGPLFLFSGLYTSSENEQVNYLQDGYAVRTFDANDGIKHTVHYFSAAHLDTFVRSVHAVLRASPNRSKRSSLVAPSYIIKSERAIILNSPTPHNQYQYIWITSPMIPEHSLHHLLFERTRWTFIDYRNIDYKIWSIYALLKSVEALHNHKFVHLAIDLKAFYFDHEMKATDWRLGNMSYARLMLRPRGDIVFPPNSQFTAPEIIQQKDKLRLESADIWSLGCVIYTVATGGSLLFQDASEVKSLTVFHDDMKQHLKMQIRQNVESDVFQNILERMLQVDPTDRKSIKNVLDYWNSIYNMEE